MDGTYPGLTTYANRRSDLQFTAEALAEGRRKAIAIWNSFPTDGDTNPPQISSTTTVNSMVEAAAFAFAILNESIRIDSQRMKMQGQGIVGEPSPALSSMTADALQTVANYRKWVADVKPQMAARSVGL